MIWGKLLWSEADRRIFGKYAGDVLWCSFGIYVLFDILFWWSFFSMYVRNNLLIVIIVKNSIMEKNILMTADYYAADSRKKKKERWKLWVLRFFLKPELTFLFLFWNHDSARNQCFLLETNLYFILCKYPFGIGPVSRYSRHLARLGFKPRIVPIRRTDYPTKVKKWVTENEAR